MSNQNDNRAKKYKKQSADVVITAALFILQNKKEPKFFLNFIKTIYLFLCCCALSESFAERTMVADAINIPIYPIKTYMKLISGKLFSKYVFIKYNATHIKANATVATIFLEKTIIIVKKKITISAVK